MMLLVHLFFILQTYLFSEVSAQKCWRTTTCTGPAAASFPGPWDAYMHSPASRTVSPARILGSNDAVLSKYPGPSTLKGNGSMLIFDFGQEVGGIVTVKYKSSGTGALGVAFTEARNWTGTNSDESNGGGGPDGALYANVSTTSSGSYTMPLDKLRGGFRYLTLFITTNATLTVDITAISLEISFQPTWANLRAYGGYFYSNDDLINRIWYAGAYTIQTTAIPPNTGREYPLLNAGWENDANVGTDGASVFVDGAKRDRAVWAGDLGIAVPTALVGTGDFESVKNALAVQYTHQNTATGELPEVGPPISFFGSDTYHMATMIGTYDYVLYSNDIAYLNSIWVGYKLAMTFITGKIDSSGMLDVTGTSNWGRAASESGHTTDGNMLLYKVLTTGATLAGWAGQATLSSGYLALAATLKAAVNEATNNWDPTVGAFKNSDTDGSLYPEDGNSMALYFDGANSSYQAQISKYLTTNWGPIGAITPELPNNIVPYVEGFEIKGHLAVRQTKRALDLMRLSWGWYLNNPYGTGCTTIEGYYDDGTFRYQNDGYDATGSYPSHAHGWSTGPTDALTSYVLGLRPTSPGGKGWMLAPQFGDLKSVQGGFTTPVGRFSASWTLIAGGYTVSYTVPAGTRGTLVLPSGSSSKAPNIRVDGSSKKGTFVASTGLSTLSASGGTHRLTVIY